MSSAKQAVWRNAEDEVLKAAVMKYGINEWSRISSLLTRKTPKQCRARWMEYLNPDIKKIEWSVEEDERLLHFSKLFPNQWRTISTQLDRTSNQCVARYYELVMPKVGKKEFGGREHELELLPARPDAVDLDEAEKEMLSEARARLANVQGKKAKRNARERMLEEAKRLALIQKKRELREAGINYKEKERNSLMGPALEYNKEIPFLKKPESVAYNTIEDDKSKPKAGQLNDATRQALKKRNRDTDDLNKQKQKDNKENKLSFVQSQQQIQKIINKAQIKRRKLNLPPPKSEIIKDATPFNAPISQRLQTLNEEVQLHRDLASISQATINRTEDIKLDMSRGTGLSSIHPNQHRLPTFKSEITAPFDAVDGDIPNVADLLQQLPLPTNDPTPIVVRPSLSNANKSKINDRSYLYRSAQYEYMSSAVKLNLPRPTKMPNSDFEIFKDIELNQRVNEEMRQIMMHDIHHYPTEQQQIGIQQGTLEIVGFQKLTPLDPIYLDKAKQLFNEIAATESAHIELESMTGMGVVLTLGQILPFGSTGTEAEELTGESLDIVVAMLKDRVEIYKNTIKGLKERLPEMLSDENKRLAEAVRRKEIQLDTAQYALAMESKGIIERIAYLRQRITNTNK